MKVMYYVCEYNGYKQKPDHINFTTKINSLQPQTKAPPSFRELSEAVPGAHHIMGYKIYFFALFPSSTPNCSISTPSSLASGPGKLPTNLHFPSLL